MRVALAIFRLTPAGGLEQHALRLAAELVGRGCEVTLVTTRAPEQLPPSLAVRLLPRRRLTNHGRLAAFAAEARKVVAQGFDRTVVFHAVAGFDLIFCADPSRADLSGWRALSPRYRAYARLERRAFAPNGDTQVLCLASAQLEAFQRRHGTPRARLHLLPPTVDPARLRVGASRRALASAAAPVWLWMGLQAHTKGLDRALRALAAAPEARLRVCGLDPQSPAGKASLRLARRLAVADRVEWVGFVSDHAVGDIIASADLLLHPARADVTGTVILEAMVNGLPVITSAVCGYGEHVARADAGRVLGEPFGQWALAMALAEASPERLAQWSANAAAYARRGDLFSGLARAADLVLAPPASHLALAGQPDAQGGANPTA